MVIEVSKELNLRRIGIDRYSLKTGLNLRVSIALSMLLINFLLIKFIILNLVSYSGIIIFYYSYVCWSYVVVYVWLFCGNITFYVEDNVTHGRP